MTHTLLVYAVISAALNAGVWAAFARRFRLGVERAESVEARQLSIEKAHFQIKLDVAQFAYNVSQVLQAHKQSVVREQNAHVAAVSARVDAIALSHEDLRSAQTGLSASHALTQNVVADMKHLYDERKRMITVQSTGNVLCSVCNCNVARYFMKAGVPVCANCDYEGFQNAPRISA